jgi:chemotaxis signal transduction protein
MTDSAQATQKEDILDIRARRLALRGQELQMREQLDEVVIVALGRERFGFSSRALREIRPLETLVEIPGMPGHCLGLTHLRGELICVVDIKGMLGLQAGSGGSQIVVLDGEHGPLAITVDRLVGFRVLRQDDVAEGQRGQRTHPLVWGVTPDLVSLVDTEALLADPQIHFHNQPSARARHRA